MAAGLEQSEHPQVQKAMNLCSSYTHPSHKTIHKSRVSSAFGELWKKDEISEDDAALADQKKLATAVLGESLVDTLVERDLQPPDVSANFLLWWYNIL